MRKEKKRSILTGHPAERVTSRHEHSLSHKNRPSAYSQTKKIMSESKTIPSTMVHLL